MTRSFSSLSVAMVAHILALGGAWRQWTKVLLDSMNGDSLLRPM
jgi:hypothetical protein